MRVFVAGATGVIGRPLVSKLIDAGHAVTGMTRSPERAERLRAQGASAVICDALDGDALLAAVAEAQPEGVIHELTDIPPDLQPRKFKTQLAGTNRLRREGTRNLVHAAQAAGVKRFVAQSIAFAYAPAGELIKDEDAPLGLDSPPPMDEPIKAIAELEHQVLHAGGIVLRYGYFYGPGSAIAAGGAYGEMARKRQFPVIGGGTGMWSLIHVEDAAAATVAALEHGAPGVYNIVDDDPAPAREWIPAFASSVGAKSPLSLPKWVGLLLGGRAAVDGMTTQRAASNAKAKRDLEWTPAHPSWREGFSAAH